VVVVRASQPPQDDERRRSRCARRAARAERPRLFQGRGLDTRLDGNCTSTGEIGRRCARTGAIRAVGGTYQGYGQKLAIERGDPHLQRPARQPAAQRARASQGPAGRGGCRDPRHDDASAREARVDSDVPESEKLSWLVLGRGASDASPATWRDDGRGAGAAGQQPRADLGKKLGFDEIKIGRADANSVLGVLPQSTVAGRTGTPSASEVVSVGKRLTRDLHLTFEQGLADAEGALKVTYRISRQFQVLVRAGYLPGVDAVYRWTFK
jgi:translocation and assembly module TamB